MVRGKKDIKQTIPPSISSEVAIPLIRRQIDRLPEIRTLRYDDPKEDAWLSTTVNILDNVFGQPNGEHERRTKDVAYASGGPIRIGMSEEECQRNHVNRCDKRKALLESYIEQLQDLCPQPFSNTTSEASPCAGSDENCVFIVHGRDSGIAAEVARFVEQLDLSPVILHEQPNEGQTIIEKFEKHSGRSNYAIVLLTGDDEGRLKGTPDLKPRARQNVILELGYFMGKLSRKNVCAVCESGIESPSDYDGVLYVPLDSEGAWKFKLARELKSVGFNIDMNKVE